MSCHVERERERRMRDGGMKVDGDGGGLGGDEYGESKEAKAAILKENKRSCLWISSRERHERE